MLSNVCVCLLFLYIQIVYIYFGWKIGKTSIPLHLSRRSGGRLSVGWIVFAVCGLLAVAGEVVEFLSAAAGAKNAGASLKSTVYSVVGSIAGAFLGAFVGIPIPVIGPVIAALLFGGLGAAGGAMLGEWTDGRQWKENVSIGKSTFLSKK